MPEINNLKDLQEEKKRLQNLRLDHEHELRVKWSKVEKQVAPYRKFIQKNFAPLGPSHAANEVKRSNPLLQKAIEFGIPLLIDRIMLGKRGFMVKEVGTWISGKLANRVVQDPPVETFHKLSQLFSDIKRIPIVGKMIEKRIKKF